MASKWLNVWPWGQTEKEEGGYSKWLRVFPWGTAEQEEKKAKVLENFQKRSEAAFTAGKNLYAPPAQVEPQEVTIPAGTTFSSTTVTVSGRDAIVKLPVTVRKRGLTVEDAGHIRAVAGELNLTGGTLTETPFRTGKNQKSLYLEGLLINGGAATKDLINLSGTSGTGPFSLFPDMYMQRMRGENIHGTAAGEHADLFQPQGSMGNFYCWMYTGYSQYQGLYLPPLKPIGNIFIDYANFGYEEGGDPITYLLWFLQKTTEANTPASYDVYLGKNVYVQPKAGQTLKDSCVWPKAGQLDTLGRAVGAEEFEVGGRKAIKFPPAARIYGYILEGPPPGGDFVPKAACGLGYVSPGVF